jgi:hypothetical protein
MGPRAGLDSVEKRKYLLYNYFSMQLDMPSFALSSLTVKMELILLHC